MLCHELNYEEREASLEQFGADWLHAVDRTTNNKRIWLMKATVFGILLLSLLSLSCSHSPPTATSDQATITLQVNPANVAAGGVCQITAIGMKKTGAPIWDGTEITFSVTSGSIDPSATAFRDGRATAQFFAPKTSGKATISAVSGTVQIKDVDVEVGIAVESLVLSANPMTLPVSGGKSTLRAVAYDENNSPVPNAPVIFLASNGTLASGGKSILTDAGGLAKDTLTTNTDTDVYAYSGKTKADTLTIKIENNPNKPPTAKFSISPASPPIGDTVHFNGSPSSDEDGRIVRWNWDFGDGATSTGDRTTHIYHTAASYHIIPASQMMMERKAMRRTMWKLAPR